MLDGVPEYSTTSRCQQARCDDDAQQHDLRLPHLQGRLLGQSMAMLRRSCTLCTVVLLHGFHSLIHLPPTQGYGDRVAQRSHSPGAPLVGPGFQLDLGLKDITLALDVAHHVKAPMPFGSVLHDRFVAASAKGRGKMDWSAIGTGCTLAHSMCCDRRSHYFRAEHC